MQSKRIMPQPPPVSRGFFTHCAHRTHAHDCPGMRAPRLDYDGDVCDPYAAIPHGARVSCDCKYTPDWQVPPSIGVLVQREGVDDYRYIQLLEERLAAAEKAGQGSAPAVKEGRAVLRQLHDAINETYLDPANNWDTSTMNYYRWKVAQAAVKLEAYAK